MLSCEYYEFSKNMYFAKYPQTAASERTILCRMFRDMTSLACLRGPNAHQILLDKKSLLKRLHKMLTPENKRNLFTTKSKRKHYSTARSRFVYSITQKRLPFF